MIESMLLDSLAQRICRLFSPSETALCELDSVSNGNAPREERVAPSRRAVLPGATPAPGALGAATFSTLTTFLQGTVSNFQVVPNPTALGWRSLFGAWYAQDNIRLRPNLTLQLGVRDEFTTGWNEQFGRAANFITSGGVLETNPIVGNSVFTQNNATRLFGPRTGLAWDPFGNAKTVVCAGYGMYYSLIDDLSFLMNSRPPYNSNLSFSS
jgi:TonB dependent receptor